MATQLTVLYDGDCGVCTHTARALTRLDTRHRLRLISLQTAALPDMPPSDELMDALHAVDGEGRWFAGAAAAVEVTRYVPLFGPISLIARLPLAMPIFGVLYGVVANNRRSISRVLGLNVCQVRTRPKA